MDYVSKHRTILPYSRIPVNTMIDIENYYLPNTNAVIVAGKYHQ